MAQVALHYFAAALLRYESSKSVLSISGYSHPDNVLRIPDNYPYDAYFLRRNSSWGWATWADRWTMVDWDIARWLEARNEPYFVSQLSRMVPDLPGMLDGQAAGRIDSWSVRFTLHHFVRGGLSLVPRYSYVRNIGLDGSGTHTTGRFADPIDLSRALAYPRLPLAEQTDSEIEKRFAALFKKKQVPRILRAIIRRLHL